MKIGDIDRVKLLSIERDKLTGSLSALKDSKAVEGDYTIQFNSNGCTENQECLKSGVFLIRLPALAVKRLLEAQLSSIDKALLNYDIDL